MTLVTSPYRMLCKTPLILGAIRFQESIFALPFAYTGMLLAGDGLPSWYQFIWITIAMVSARTLGMSSNRLIDRFIDSRNPRNSDRHLPAGRLTAWDMIVLAFVSGVVFLFAALQLNSLSFVLAPVAATYLVLYPYTKRFTWAANFILGWALAIAPVAAWIGVTGSFSWEPILLSLAVALWAGSFDIIYHVPDIKFYLNEGLYSVASRFGAVVAFRVSRVMDVISLACLLVLGALMTLDWPYYVGWLISASLIAYKHKLVSPSDVSRLNIAFFRINAYVSTSILGGTFFALLI